MLKLKKVDWMSIKPESMSEKITRKFIHGDKIMLAEIRLKKGAVVPEHTHESEQISWIIEGELLFELEGEKIAVGEGEVLVIPSGVPHKATALQDTLDIDLFSPIRRDWIDNNDQYLRGN